MGSNMKIFILLLILGAMVYVNYRYNNIILKIYNQGSKLPKLMIVFVSVIALFAPKLLKNNLLLEYFKGFLPGNVIDKIDTYQEMKEKVNQPVLKPVKRNVTESTKKYVAANQQWKCLGCSKMLEATYEVDHKIPLHQGGSNEITNLRALCRNCHGKKTLEDNMRRKNLI